MIPASATSTLRPFYGYGRSEHLVGDVLRHEDDWVLSTKVGRRLRPRLGPQKPGDAWVGPLPFEIVFDYSYDGAMRSYEDSLQRLGVNHIDILYIHDIDELHPRGRRPAEDASCGDGGRLQGPRRASPQRRHQGDRARRQRGEAHRRRPRAWPVGLLPSRRPLHSSRAGAARTRFFPAIEKHGASVVIGGPFNSGVLVGRDLWNYATVPEPIMKRVKAIARVCDAHGVADAGGRLAVPARPSRWSSAPFPVRARPPS